METINLQRRVGIVSIILTVLAIITIALAFTGCKKGKDFPKFDGKYYEIGLRPTLNGDVVPWLSQKSQKKGFGDFVHKYKSHIIRIATPAGDWVADIPITNRGQVTGDTPGTSTAGTDLYTFNLLSGDYLLCVMPVEETPDSIHARYTTKTPGSWGISYPVGTDASANPNTGTGTSYTWFDPSNWYLNDAACFYSPSVQSISVIGKSTVTLNTMTDMGLILFDAGGVQATITPTVWSVKLDSVVSEKIINISSQPIASIDLLDYVWTNAGVPDPIQSSLNSHHYDVTVSHVHWGYRYPGQQVDPVGNNFNRSIILDNGSTDTFGITGDCASAPTFLAFDNPIRTNMPNVWLRDYITANPQWGPNKVVRVTFSAGTGITVDQLDWFGDKIDVVGK